MTFEFFESEVSSDARLIQRTPNESIHEILAKTRTPETHVNFWNSATEKKKKDPIYNANKIFQNVEINFFETMVCGQILNLGKGINLQVRVMQSAIIDDKKTAGVILPRLNPVGSSKYRPTAAYKNNHLTNESNASEFRQHLTTRGSR